MKLQTAFRKNPWKFSFFLVAALGLFIMSGLSSQYGLTNDEPMHQLHGELLLKYFQGKDSIAALSPLDSAGNIIKTHDAIADERFRGMNFFGGFFDLTVSFLHQLFPKTGVYEFRHLITALFGFLTMLLIALSAKAITRNWRAAFIAFLLAILSPRLFGHSMVNPKDLPFATLYIFVIYQLITLISELPKVPVKRIVLISLGIGVSLSIRISGLLLFIWLTGVLGSYWILESVKERFSKKQIMQGVKFFSVALVIIFASYGLCLLLWPWAFHKPLGVFTILKKLSHFEVFHSYELFRGRWYWDNPSSYLPVWILITIPLGVLTGLLFAPFLFWLNKKVNDPRKYYLQLSLLWIAIVLPVLYIILKKSNVYNEARHVLFVIPPLITLAALSWDYIFERLKNTVFLYTSIMALVVFLLQPLIWSIKNHPLQALYFSPIIGGADGAFKRFETDYWGFSTKPAVQWIVKNIPPGSSDKPIRIKMFYGDPLKVTYYLNKYQGYVYAPGNGNDYDYEILFTAQAKFDSTLLDKWPPEGTVHEIKISSTPVCAIVKNIESEKLRKLETQLKAHPTAGGYLELSLKYYYANNFNSCVNACLNGLKVDSTNVYLWNNLCSAYNSLQMYSDAVRAGKKAVSLAPQMELAHNNLKIAEEGLKMQSAKKLTTNDYIRLSYNYHMQGDFQRAIEILKQFIAIEPGNEIAWNNLCSAYNALGEYRMGEQACLKALEIKPDFTLARNNLAESRSHLNQNQPK